MQSDPPLAKENSVVYHTVKRSIDILLSFMALLILSPLFLPIIVILKFTGEGEIFYKQKRVGYHNNLFEIWKFATMLKDSPNMGTKDITLRNDPRVTPVGKYLRMTKINELPQIINVLKGDMTIVGPRPLMIGGFEGYSDYFKERVYRVKPGLTGIGSIVFRDEEKIMTDSDLSPRECYEHIILPYKGELEMWYQTHRSTWTDTALVFCTIWTVLFPNNKLAYRLFKNLPKRKF